MKRAARRPPRTAPRTIIAMKYFFSRSSLQVAGDVEEVGEVGEAVGEGCTPVTSTTNGMVALRPSGRCSSAYNVKMISGLIGFALTVQFTFIHSFVILSSTSQWESDAHYHLDQKDNLSPFCGKAVLPALISHDQFRVSSVWSFKESRVRSEYVVCVDDPHPRSCIRSWLFFWEWSNLLTTIAS